MKRQECDSSCFLGKNFLCDDFIQNMFVYQPPFNTSELEKDQSTEYVVGWKSTGLFKSKLLPLYVAFILTYNIFDTKQEYNSITSL